MLIDGSARISYGRIVDYGATRVVGDGAVGTVFDGSGEEKTNTVLSYLKQLEDLGENHYNQIATKLDSISIKIDDLGKITSRQLDQIKEILACKIEVVDQFN